MVENLFTLLTALGFAYFLHIAGRVIMPSGQKQASLFVGLGYFLCVCTLWAVITAWPLWVACLLMLADLTLTALWRMRTHGHENPFAGFPLPVFILGIPLLWGITNAHPNMWDEFSHWLWAAEFISTHHTVPRAGLPESMAYFPAYPQGMGFISSIFSQLQGMFIEQAGAIMNGVFTLGFGALLATLVAGGARASWKHYALGILLATLLNPVFVPKIALTGYAETLLSISLAVATFLSWRGLCAEGKNQRNIFFIQAGLVMVGLVAAKPAGLVLCLLLVVALSACMVSKRYTYTEIGLNLVVLAAPALITYAAWRWHVAGHLAGDEFTIGAIADWHWQLIPLVLAGMVGVLAKKIGFTLFLGALTALAFQPAKPLTALGMLCRITLFINIGYIGFLGWIYIAAFGATEAAQVASFWRYLTAVGWLNTLVVVIALAPYIKPFILKRPRAAWVLIPAAAILPLWQATGLIQDTDDHKPQLRELSHQLLHNGIVPGQVCTFTQSTTQAFSYLMLRYLLHPTWQLKPATETTGCKMLLEEKENQLHLLVMPPDNTLHNWSTPTPPKQ